MKRWISGWMLAWLLACQAVATGVGATAVTVADVTAVDAAAVDAAVSWETRIDRFRVAGTAAGFLRPAEWIGFIEGAVSGEARPDRLQAALEAHGVLLVALLIVVGGLALNLTPCVLPMIPINIAIIGAGAEAGSRARGLALGSLYGLGIALVYGLLGLLVVLTGARFGTLNASPAFNLAVAAVFVVMALAMFDVVTIDLSRFQAGGVTRRRGSFVAATALGGLAALLAGACVAPVVFSVLLLAAHLYAAGRNVGLVLPFLLGLGMALPWPFAGAGLSFLPRPGPWMERVKRAFGVVILLAGLWYGFQGWRLMAARCAVDTPPARAAAEPADARIDWLTSLGAALARAEAEGKPVVIDFWATWCANCLRMDRTTFRDADVVRAMEALVPVKIQAEDMTEPRTAALLDRFGVIGLPTYVVLMPAADGSGRGQQGGT